MVAVNQHKARKRPCPAHPLDLADVDRIQALALLGCRWRVSQDGLLMAAIGRMAMTPQGSG